MNPKNAILIVKVIPNSSKNSIEGFQGEALRIKIHAPPDKNKANEELIEFLAKALKVSKSRIQILAGHTSRLKKLEIQGATELVAAFLATLRK